MAVTIRLRTAWVGAALMLLLVACGSGGGGEMLPWSDDFSDPTSGWRAESDATAEVGYRDGVMRVLVAVPNSLAWASAERQFSDFHLTVEATQVAGPDDNEYGVLVRVKDPNHFYRFSISGDGYYQISVYDDGVWQVLSGDDWLPSDAINHGMATNRLEVIGQGVMMTFVVNGVQLAQVQDGRYAKGDIGLYAGSFFEPNVEVYFDNLHVDAP
ncbi:MAG TPA: DUF1080 domain-containing protein [Chloroflexi bacterium]|nr:DUF1080 domain-containing protein [Chloroflexota bacterium]